MPQFVNLDAGESIFFARELETIRAGNYDVKFQEPKLLNIIPKSMEGDPTVDTITHRSFTRVGIAKMGGTEYANDFPRVDVFGTETSVKVKPVHAGYGYNKDEIARAAKVGRPLEAMRATAARKAIDMKLDEIARSGEATTGLYGLYNFPGTSSLIVADGASTKTDWANKTSDEILADLYSIYNYALTSTGGMETINTIALPMANYLLIAQKRLSNENEVTVLQYFQNNVATPVNVLWLQGLETAAASDALYDSTCLGIGWNNSPDKLVLDLPLGFTQEEVEKNGLDYSIPCRAKTAGVQIFFPLSVVKIKGI